MNSSATHDAAALDAQADATSPTTTPPTTTPADTAPPDTAPSDGELQALALPFAVLRNIYKLNFDGDLSTQRMIPVSNVLLAALLESLASRVRVDEEWYLAAYPDIAEAIADGKFDNARHHYLKFGYIENRLPRFIPVDEAFYRASNRDIAEKLRLGQLPSAQLHFEQFGFKEGRLPAKGWRLF